MKAHNNMIDIVQFQSLAQDRDELVPQFSARLHGAAAICEFTVTCDCTKKVSYAEAMQSFQLVRGLYDTEIQEKILSEAANKDLSLADITKLPETGTREQIGENYVKARGLHALTAIGRAT